MSRHLADETLLDVLEGTAEAASRAHLEACPACAEKVEAARAGLLVASEGQVPEPSPLYWEVFRRNVGRRIEAEGTGRGWRWAWLPVLAAAAAILIAVPALRTPVVAVPSPSAVLPAWSALPPADEDAALAVLEGLVTADATLPMVAGDRDVVESLADLSDDEALAVQDALRTNGQEADLSSLALSFVALLALAGPIQAPGPGPGPGAGPRSRPDRRPREEVFKMVDAYMVSNLQESLGLTDEQFVKLLPLVKRLQTERRESMEGRMRAVRELRRLLESGTATEGQIEEQLRDAKRAESEGPDKVRKATEAIDGTLSPLQQAKFRVLESDVERRIREIIGQARRQRSPGIPGARPGAPGEQP